MEWIPWIFLIMNVFTFLLYVFDKLQAVRNERVQNKGSAQNRSTAGRRAYTAHRRVPERTLLIAAAAFGSLGALLAMRVFRHKIRKPVFIYGVPVLLALHLMLVFLFMRYHGSLTGPAHRTYSDSDFGIETFISAGDADGDTIDDQTDILSGVRGYLATKPQYKSAYYVGGWPDDEYGVCTDVVARGFLAAGYNLQELVDADIRANPAVYAIEKPDPNIDFRRVRNLQVFFSRTLQNLTCDPKDIAEWQGGDVVVWKNHIGIVSDRRNKKGIPYVLHHGSPVQPAYEQDILEEHGEILGHYRVW